MTVKDILEVIMHIIAGNSDLFTIRVQKPAFTLIIRRYVFIHEERPLQIECETRIHYNNRMDQTILDPNRFLLVTNILARNNAISRKLSVETAISTGVGIISRKLSVETVISTRNSILSKIFHVNNNLNTKETVTKEG